MNINAKLLTSVATILTAGLICLEEPAVAQSNCKSAKGNVVSSEDISSPVASEIVSNAGWLNGTAIRVFTGSNPNLQPTVFTFFSQVTFTTKRGQLKASSVNLFDFATGQGTVLMYVDPSASTGIFAGATGTLFENITRSTVTGTTLTVQLELSR